MRVKLDMETINAQLKTKVVVLSKGVFNFLALLFKTFVPKQKANSNSKTI